MMVAHARGLVALLALVPAALVAGCYGASTDEADPMAGGSGGGGGSAGVSGSGAGVVGTDGGEGPVASAGASVGPEFPEPPTEPPEAVDLLFVVDNSISMADKQQILLDAVPQLVRRLITPNCLDADGAVVGSTDATGACASGEPEFAAVTNLHLGIISSSMGGHGGQICDNAAGNPMLDDHARMMGSVRSGLTSWNDTGFLSWDPTGAGSTPPGESDPAALITTFQDHLRAVGETGCGYESTLEAFYRFLIDPEPPLNIVQDSGVSRPEGIDQIVLDQREAFLRPDSLVGVIVLSDENDCSIINEGQGWLVGLQTNAGAPFQMPRATSACATDPQSECCRSCAANEAGGPPEGCQALSSDPECAKGTLTVAEDNLNLRCIDQKRRFGFDLLYPIQRYINGLSALEVPNREGSMVSNPLFVRDGFVRHPSRVFLAGAVGVPWQDLADDASLSGDGLRYLTAAELQEQNRWELILGSPDSGLLPTDPLMVESTEPRSGTHPLLGVPVAPSTSTDPQENPINGHEHVSPKHDDLQYACIFPLVTPRDCASGAASNACDCNAEDVDRNRPVCQPPGGGATGTTQYFAKAYPGLRHLELLQGLGERSIVTSVCPKMVSGEGVEPSYGYNPLTTSILELAAPVLRGQP